jgi:TonB family protein
LRSARADKTSQASKDRVRALLGIVDLANNGNGSPLPPLPHRARAKRSRTIARFIPFQHLISPPKPASTRKFGAVAVASVQVAALFAALFVRPMPRIEPVGEAVAARRDKPELSFIVLKVAPREPAKVQALVPDSSPKTTASRKDVFGTAISSRPLPKPDALPPTESIVGEEHAGALTQKEAIVTKPNTPLAPEFVELPATLASSPVVFQPGMTNPERIAGIDPVYPLTARMRRVSGVVVMHCVLTEKGLAQNCTISNSPAYLDEAVLAAARTWRFTPVTWQGRAVSVNYVFKIKFKLR